MYISAAITSFSYANFVLVGYLKDMQADKATGYKIFPVVFGWSKTIITGNILAMVTLLLFWWLDITNIDALIFGIAGSATIIFGQIVAHLNKRRNEKAALIPILSTVRSFVITHRPVRPFFS